MVRHLEPGMKDSLRELALRAGIELEYEDTWGERHTITERTLDALLDTMGLTHATEAQLRASLARLESLDGDRASREPERAWWPEGLKGEGRRWSLAVQLYGLRSGRNWGIGDFTDLKAVMRGAAAIGAAAVGINPLHALFPDRPEHASPYSPSSRLFLNPLYLDVEEIDDFKNCRDLQDAVGSRPFQEKLASARSSETVDYGEVAALKRSVLKLSYRAFCGECLASNRHPRARAFRKFQAESGPDLRQFATFNAIARARRTDDWRRWPRGLQDPQSEAVAAFAREHLQEIEFHEYLQWQLALQLASANEAARESGMSIGLYSDLAVGVEPSGAEAWSRQPLWVSEATIGAPPDALNPAGQNWGLPPPNRFAMSATSYRHFQALMSANMRQAGALRVDHIFGLMRLWWIPQGRPATEGAYVHYPCGDLFNVLAQESRRHRCLVIGENLGTPPREFEEVMREAGVLAYRLLYFEHYDVAFPKPGEYAEDVLISAGTHDLPSLPMWWSSQDIALREALGLWPNDHARRREAENRRRARTALTRRLCEERLLETASVPREAPVEAVYAYLARTPCKLLMVQLEDVLELHTQNNVPGTTDEYPNWRQKLPVSVETALASPRLAALAEVFRREGRADSCA